MQENNSNDLVRIKTSAGTELFGRRFPEPLFGITLYECFDIVTGAMRGYVGYVAPDIYGPLCKSTAAATSAARNIKGKISVAEYQFKGNQKTK